MAFIYPLEYLSIMNKQKIKLYITPYEDVKTTPINLTILSEALDFINGKFEIVSIEIRLNDYKKPSEFYFELLSGLCKTITKSIITDVYTGIKSKSIFKVDSFSYMNIFMDNSETPYTVLYENQKKQFKTLEDFIIVLSVL